MTPVSGRFDDGIIASLTQRTLSVRLETTDTAGRASMLVSIACIGSAIRRPAAFARPILSSTGRDPLLGTDSARVIRGAKYY